MNAALILAGGQGLRLGGADKAFLALGGQPLIAHVLARLTPQAEQIAISANGDATRFADFGLPVLADGQPGRGPLAGVAAGLAWAQSLGADALLTVPVDTPFIPHDLLARLCPPPSAAVYAGRQHHLVALWPVGFLPALQGFLAVPGACKVRDALALCGAGQVEFHGAADPFMNLNTPDELAAARRRV